MKLRKFLSIPVFSVLLLLVFVYYITTFVFLDDWLGLQSSAGLLNALIVSLLASLSLFCFVVCVIKDPGGVPSSYAPDVEGGASSDQESRNSAQKKHCDKCSAYKPPRTHHCRVCRRCVLRMDHHCLWINNCVGHRNYKNFVVLVFYATMACIHSSVIIVSCATQKNWDFAGRGPLRIFYFFQIMCSMMICGLGLTLGTLLGWHIYLIAHNLTTIEYYEKIRAEWLARKSGQSYRHPFNVGVYRNFTLVLGPSMLKWLCPTAMGHLKDGISFPTTRDSS